MNNTNMNNTINSRVQITKEGKHNGQRGTVIAENKFSMQVKVDGTTTNGVWVRKPHMHDAGCKLVRGRRPKAKV